MNDKEYLQKLGENIVNIRKAKNLSQFQLACLLDMEDSSLRRIEKGRVNSSILMLRKIAIGLDIPLEQLLQNK